MTSISIAHSCALPVRRHHVARVPVYVWNILVVAAIASLGVAYLVRVNETLSASYEIRAAEERIEKFGAAVRANQIKIAELSTVDSLTAQASALGMVPVSGVEYVTVSHPGVAMR
jgi:thiamine biosynthesis protein ThiC